MTGFADVLIGLQFGDEGKAKAIDALAPDYDIIARFNGGANAGHTIRHDGKTLALRQIPSGVLYPQKQLYIGSGCAIDIIALSDELDMLERTGCNVDDRLRISSKAVVVQPHHKHIDRITGKTIGTTANGIGPAYADRSVRMLGERVVNVRLAELVSTQDETFQLIEENFRHAIESHQLDVNDPTQEVTLMRDTFRRISHFVDRNPLYLENAVRKGSTVLFEGAQSCFLDVSTGTFPFVTSSGTIASAAYVGGDLSVTHHRKVIGVAKMIMSRVGNGPFPSEVGGKKSREYCLADGGMKYTKTVEGNQYDPRNLIGSSNLLDVNIALRMLGGEYGTGTGRPRRIGYFDLVLLDHAVRQNGVDELFLTKCDLLEDFASTQNGTMKIVTGYTLNNEAISFLPASDAECDQLKISCTEYVPPRDVSLVRTYNALPEKLTTLVETIEKKTSVRVVGLGTGPSREEMVIRA